MCKFGVGGASTCPCRKRLVFSGRLSGVFTESGQIVIVLADFYGNGSKLSWRRHLKRKKKWYLMTMFSFTVLFKYVVQNGSLTCTCCCILFHWLELSLCSIVAGVVYEVREQNNMLVDFLNFLRWQTSFFVHLSCRFPVITQTCLKQFIYFIGEVKSLLL